MNDDSRDADIAFELFNEIGIIDQLAGTMLERVLPAGLTRAQFTVLNHFVRLRLDAQSPAQLAQAFQVRRPTMTSTLARMERAQLVVIRPDPADGRGKLVSLTDKGQAVRAMALAAIRALSPSVTTLIDAQTIGQLLPPLRTLRIGLDAAR
jgi:DNA-binding MarR family transcriptional regulator